VYEPYNKPPAFAEASYHKKMEDIKDTFTQINMMLKSVQSKMAAAPTKDYLPLIAEVLSRMEEMVANASQVSQSESGYDTCDADVSDVVSVSSLSSSASMSSSSPAAASAQLKGDKHIDKIKTAICQLAPSGVYDVAKAKKRRRRRQARRVSQVVPTEFLTLWQSLKEKDVVLQSEDEVEPTSPFPVVNWSQVNYKRQANIPLPSLFPVHGCSDNPSFYSPIHVNGTILPSNFEHHQKVPFGTLPGFATNLGIIAPPDQHTSNGYIYVPGDGWVLHATIGGQENDKIKSPPPRSRRTRSRAPWRWRAGG